MCILEPYEDFDVQIEICTKEKKKRRKKNSFSSPSDGHLNGVLVEEREREKESKNRAAIITTASLRVQTQVSRISFTHMLALQAKVHISFICSKRNQKRKEKSRLLVELRKEEEKKNARGEGEISKRTYADFFIVRKHGHNARTHVSGSFRTLGDLSMC